jgi:D-3-phosphoglycerate dehydrogenase / 2-oxoglutarate reductase
MAEQLHILTLNNIAAVGLKRFPAEHYRIGSHEPAPDAILVRSHDMHAMEVPASVKAIGRAGAGTNNIPVAKMSDRGVPVFNAPGANANAVKELVIAGLLLAARNIAPALQFVSALKGDDASLDKQVEDGKKHFAGTELPGRTLGIIGLGKIGSLVADAAIRLGMNVLGYDPEITVEAAWSLPSQVRKAHSIEEVLRGSEFVSVHVPLLPETRNLINAERLHLMKSGAVLLNFARDGVVDTAAVVAALEAKKLRWYVCDFPSARLQGHPHAVALPHLGASTREAEDNCAVMVADQVRDYLENGNVVNAVNFPDVSMGRESPYRVGIANANVPNMLGQISTTMARAGLNIHNMLNKSRGQMAYTLVDVDSPVPQEAVRELEGIDGVLMVRYLPTEAGAAA